MSYRIESERIEQFSLSLISPDIPIAEQVDVFPGETVEVPFVVTDELKAHDEQVKRLDHIETVLKFDNTRSHIMQNANMVEIIGSLSDPDSILRITNIGPNTSRFLKGTKVAQQCEFKTPALSGNALMDHLFNRKDIIVDNNAWNYLFTKEAEGLVAQGIELWVKPYLQYGIRPKEELVVFNGISNSTHNRSFVNNNLVVTLPKEFPHFWNGELSSRLYLSDRVHGVITGVRTRGEVFVTDGQSESASRHFPSTLIRGGHTGRSPEEGNDIRIEIFGPSEGPGRVLSVQMLFFPA